MGGKLIMVEGSVKTCEGKCGGIGERKCGGKREKVEESGRKSRYK